MSSLASYSFRYAEFHKKRKHIKYLIISCHRRYRCNLSDRGLKQRLVNHP